MMVPNLFQLWKLFLALGIRQQPLPVTRVPTATTYGAMSQADTHSCSLEITSSDRTAYSGYSHVARNVVITSVFYADLRRIASQPQCEEVLAEIIDSIDRLCSNRAMQGGMSITPFHDDWNLCGRPDRWEMIFRISGNVLQLCRVAMTRGPQRSEGLYDTAALC